MSHKYSFWSTGMTEPAKFEVLDGEYEILYNGKKYHSAHLDHNTTTQVVYPVRQFKVGDYVKIISYWSENRHASITPTVGKEILGWVGKVVALGRDKHEYIRGLIGVEFTQRHNIFHDINTEDIKVQAGHGYWFSPDQIEKVD